MLSFQASEKLDLAIASFLRLLSPFFLLKPAHKIIEFFIRRYQIHEYNVNDVVECVLPYHETNYFARMIQLTK